MQPFPTQNRVLLLNTNQQQQTTNEEKVNEYQLSVFLTTIMTIRKMKMLSMILLKKNNCKERNQRKKV